MTLPYPYEAETGRLTAVDGARRDPLDIERRVSQLVVPDDLDHVDIAGHRLRVREGQTAQRQVERMRRAITRRLLQRRPNADETTWRRFVSSLRTALSNQEQLDEAALRQTLYLIDSL